MNKLTNQQIEELNQLAMLPDEAIDTSSVGRNKPVRAIARTGISGKHLLNPPETPPRATRLDGLIPAYPAFKSKRITP